MTTDGRQAGLTPSSSGAVGGTASPTGEQVLLVAHLPVRMAGQLSPAAPWLGAAWIASNCLQLNAREW